MPIFGKSIYIHVPFCLNKCPYCHFYSISSFDRQVVEEYVNAVISEIDLYDINNEEIVSIYFGGGTPSILNAEDIEKILEKINLKKDVEITLEVNPSDITFEKYKKFLNANINRISIGIVSFNDNELSALGRKHSSKMALDAIIDAEKAGIKNISIDLLYDIPKQTINSFIKSLNYIEKLPINHISLYNLTFEENTLFYKNQERIKKTLPTEKESFQMLSYAAEFLKNLGFNRYEISAFAKEGFISKHNSGYWLNREFYGLGASAFGHINNVRYQNVPIVSKYIDLLSKNVKPIEFQEKLLEKQKLKELFIINLRMIQGVHESFFENISKEFKKEFISILKILEKEGFLIFKNDFIRLSEKGLLFYDYIAEKLI